jgi:hypothetical protein
MPNRADYRGATSPLASVIAASPNSSNALPWWVPQEKPGVVPPLPPSIPQQNLRRQVEPDIRELVQSLDPGSTVREGEYVRGSDLPMPPAQEEGLVEKLGAILRGIPSRVKQFQESNKERGELATHLGRLTGENPENFLHLSVEEMRLQLQAIGKAIELPAITSQ